MLWVALSTLGMDSGLGNSPGEPWVEQMLHEPQSSLQDTTPVAGAQLVLGSWSITGLGQGSSSTHRTWLVCGIWLASHPQLPQQLGVGRHHTTPLLRDPDPAQPRCLVCLCHTLQVPTLTGMDGPGAESSAMGSMLAMASTHLHLPPGAQARAQKQGRRVSVGCRSAGKQGDKFLFSGAELPCCLLA